MHYKKIIFYLLLLTTNQASPIQLTEWLVWAITNPNKSISIIATTYYAYRKIQYIFFWAVAHYFTAWWMPCMSLGTYLLEYAQKEYDKGNKAFLHYLAHHHNNQAFLCCVCELYRKDKDKNKWLLFFLLDQGVNSDITYGIYSPLKRACQNNDVELVKKLLKNNAKPNIPPTFINLGCGYGGGTEFWSYERHIYSEGGPLVIAFYKNSPKIIKLLIEYNAEPIMLQNHEQTTSPLHPSYVLKHNDYISFNHFIDYCYETTSNLNSLKTDIYKYWLAKQIFDENKLPYDINKTHILPLLTIHKNFNQSIELLYQKYIFTDEQKKEIYEKKEKILQIRRDNANSFLPMITT